MGITYQIVGMGLLDEQGAARNSDDVTVTFTLGDESTFTGTYKMPMHTDEVLHAYCMGHLWLQEAARLVRAATAASDKVSAMVGQVRS